MSRNIPILIAAAIFALAFEITPAYTQLAVIVHPKAGVSDLTKDELKKIYIAEQREWQQGGQILLTDRKENDATAKRFYDSFLEAAQLEVRKRWLSKVVQGQIKPPKSFNTDEGIIKFVSDNRAAIGVVALRSLNVSVKAIAIDGKRPGDPGYALK